MRPAPTSEDHERAVASYDRLNTGPTLAGQLLDSSHRDLERTLRSGLRFDRVLEVGAGTGHHLRFVSHPYREYCLTDASEAMLAQARAKYPSARYPALRTERQDAKALSYPDASFDRLIATHVLEHIPDPVTALTEWNRVVRPGGVISLVLPCDPGMLWRLGRHFGPRRNARRAGLQYDYLMATEHINAIFNLVTLVRFHFADRDERWSPLRVPLADLNLFYICHIYKAGN